MRRFIDIFFSFTFIIFFSGVFFLLALLNLAIQGRPIFFICKRLGKNGSPFNMIKFRTMENGKSISSVDDERRITNWGYFLRKSSLDEIPVFINVLIGNMNIVGPRPMPVKYLKRFNDHQLQRLEIRPGITGLAQVSGRNELSWEKRFDLDVKYKNNRSLFLDLKIIFKTIFVVIKGIGVSSKNSLIMPEFMGLSEIKEDTNSVE